MKSSEAKEEFENFVSTKGKIESVAGHVYMCIGFWIFLKDISPNLASVVNSEEVIERIWVHDIGETSVGDVSLASKIDNVNLGKDQERTAYQELISPLPEPIKNRLISWFDDFEDGSGSKPLEALVARWLDHLQGDHFALTFGIDLTNHSETIEKIIKKRSVLRSRELIDALKRRAQELDRNEYGLAATEVQNIALAHIDLIREAGIKVDLTELGF